MFQGGDDGELGDLIDRELRGKDTVKNGSSKLNTTVGSLAPGRSCTARAWTSCPS